MSYLIPTIIVLTIAAIVVGTRESARVKNATTKYSGAEAQLRNDIVGRIVWLEMSEEQVVDTLGRPSRRTFRQLQAKTMTTPCFRGNRRIYLDNGRVAGWSD